MLVTPKPETMLKVMINLRKLYTI